MRKQFNSLRHMRRMANPLMRTGRSSTIQPYSGDAKITAGINVYVRLYRR